MLASIVAILQSFTNERNQPLVSRFAPKHLIHIHILSTNTDKYI